MNWQAYYAQNEHYNDLKREARQHVLAVQARCASNDNGVIARLRRHLGMETACERDDARRGAYTGQVAGATASG